ncbi:hypothetical protein [Salipiger mucosus]|uniref:Response regulatory domain-containing protein n=1 Tax=Salipiger mucosus DSM 16094 TaxID=1123237 RepID=S9QTM2_9RHOB|nr:hypothetical protein [Salipiger mucosus]EPX82987.1 hypothetical protein Salmuc_04139 [Salipiger mucosus DSM 16094]
MCPYDDAVARRPVVFVFVKDAFVVEDVTRTVTELFPDAIITSTSKPEDVPGKLEGLPHLDMAVVHLSPDEVHQSQVGAVLRERGARLLLVGDAAEESHAAAGFDVLVRPFRTQDLEAHLKRTMAR